jgi:NAD(P)-dependent dehydrogenase (short-subunit alcohol dehydrogenase family)
MDDATFTGKVVLITGASEGIGRALALELAGQRTRLALAARNSARLEELAGACVSAGAECLVVPSDIGLEPDCRSLVSATLHRFGRLDALVNNAGIAMRSRLDELEDLGVLERLIRVNYLGSAWTTRHALDALRKSRGRIVAIVGGAGLTGLPTASGYSASKHAMVGFFESLRRELAGSGVSVTIVAPDFVRTDLLRRAAGPDGRPLGRDPVERDEIMSAEECAHVIVRAMERRQRLLLTSTRLRAGRWLKLLAPGLTDRIVVRALAGH